MIRSLLVAVDGSDSSMHALREAIVLARAERAAVSVVSVVPGYQGDLRLLGSTGVLDQIRGRYTAALERARADADVAGVRIKTLLEEGEPAEMILEAAVGADLVVVGREGRSLLDIVPMGSVASRLLALGDRDILVVPSRFNLGLERMVLAYDGSRDSRKAAERAFAIAATYGSQLTVVTVHDLPEEGFALNPEITALMEHEARNIQKPLRDAAREKELLHAEFIVSLGNPVDEIRDAVVQRNAGLLVMGTRGRGGLGRLLLGSVSERTIGKAACPVWIAK